VPIKSSSRSSNYLNKTIKHFLAPIHKGSFYNFTDYYFQVLVKFILKEFLLNRFFDTKISRESLTKLNY
jgi:hypothetical protein